MKRNSLMFTAFIVLLSFLVSYSTLNVEAAAKTTPGIVDSPSGTITVYSGTKDDKKIVGYLKTKAKVQVYVKLKSGYSMILFKGNKRYVETKSLRFYKTMSSKDAKALVDRAIKKQRLTWEKPYTKAQLYSMLSPVFTKGYIDAFINEHTYISGDTKEGKELYSQIQTEIYGYNIDSYNWDSIDKVYYPKKPQIEYYLKDGKEYLSVSQILYDWMNNEHFNQSLYLRKNNTTDNWRVYDIYRKY
jgi:hypothetical protein